MISIAFANGRDGNEKQKARTLYGLNKWKNHDTDNASLLMAILTHRKSCRIEFE